MKNGVIIDIDGTLASMNGRGPFDWSKVHEDLANRHIVNICNMLYHNGYTIIIFSGRDSCCRDLTLRWLSDNGIMFDELHMRGVNDNRKDSIVKREMYDRHVHGKYNIEFVLDDRNQVVDMWRKDLKIPCLQVNYGDF